MNIRKILESSKPEDIFDTSIWKDQYQAWIKAVHPDKNPDPKAREAFERLITYKEIIENGVSFSDELCDITFKDNILTFKGPMDILNNSYQNYLKIYSSVSRVDTFTRYLPEKMYFDGSDLKVVLSRRAILLHNRNLEEKHCRWVLNRLLEFSTLLNIRGNWSHCGLNPNSVLITPEDHGIQVISFHHSVPTNSHLKSVIGENPYRNWYPPEIFVDKVAIPSIDSEMSKRICCTLLGDKSGAGLKLRGSVDDDIFDFLISKVDDIHGNYIQYQQILDKQPRIFHELKL